MPRLILAVLLVAGCGGASVPTPTTFSGINAQIFTPSCTFSSCHSAQGASDANHLDLTADPYNALVGAPAQNMMAMMQGLDRVKAGDSANSFMYIKLNLMAQTVAGQKVCEAETATVITDYGSCMPQTSTPLDPATIAAIKTWIDSGAPNN